MNTPLYITINLKEVILYLCVYHILICNEEYFNHSNKYYID